MQVVKGMRDFYPEQYRLREWLFNIWRKASLNSGFEFYDCPVVEHEEIYIRKAGEEIGEQLYNFEDKSNRRLALRPEMTPSLARMVIQKSRELPQKLKWAAIAQCFRYERMTKGRRREHYQWNLDVLGEPTILAELELLVTAIHALEQMGLNSSDVKLRISNRKLLSDVLSALDLPLEQHIPVFMQVDKLGKVEDLVLVQGMINSGIKSETANRILSWIRLKSLDEVTALLADLGAKSQGLDEIKTLLSLLERYGFGEYLQFDFSIVRGLAYYTGTVFEFFDASKSHRAIAGGGRYDNLIQNLATEPGSNSVSSLSIPAVGFGFGDVVILDLLEEKGKLPDLKMSLDYYLIPLAGEETTFLLPVLAFLRSRGYAAEIHLPLQKPRKMFERAEERGARKVIVAGSEERGRGTVKLKDMQTRSEEEIPLMEFMQYLDQD